jgi:hypothetical protein
MEVFALLVAKTLKPTLDTIIDDKTDGLEDGLVMRRIYQEDPMEDAFIDDVEYAGGGLISEKEEGAELATLTMKEGGTMRYIARTFGARMIITDEALEDSKYPQVIKLGRRLKRSFWKTVEYDAALPVMRGFNSAYTGGTDGLSLFNSAHTLPNGGTFSNLMATPLSPSKPALVAARTQIATWPGHDGLIEGEDVMAAVFPVAQWAVWEELKGSSLTPRDGNFAEINVVNSSDKLNFELIEWKYWQNTTTNWMLKTGVEGGLRWLWRRKVKSKSYIDEDNEVVKHKITARWDRKWSDPRGAYGVNA